MGLTSTSRKISNRKSSTFIKIFSIRELETFSGIKAHTLRIWERRYSILNPGRSQGNNRLYSIDELGRILNFSLLNRNGFKISILSSLSTDEIDQKIKGLTSKEAQLQKTVNDLIICMYRLDTESFEMIFDTCMLTWPIETVINEIVYKFLQKTGLLWKGNRLTEEHFAVTIIRNKIILGIEKAGINQRKSKKILLFLPEAGQLDLMLLYTRYILTLRGFEVLYMGSDVSITNLKTVILLKQPNCIFTYLPKRCKFQVCELASLMYEYLPDSKLVIACAETETIETHSDNVLQLGYEDALSFISGQRTS